MQHLDCVWGHTPGQRGLPVLNKPIRKHIIIIIIKKNREKLILNYPTFRINAMHKYVKKYLREILQACKNPWLHKMKELRCNARNHWHNLTWFFFKKMQLIKNGGKMLFMSCHVVTFYSPPNQCKVGSLGSINRTEGQNKFPEIFLKIQKKNSQ